MNTTWVDSHISAVPRPKAEAMNKAVPKALTHSGQGAFVTTSCLPSSFSVGLVPAAPSSAQHQHRNVRMRQHLLGFAAQQQAFDAFAAMRGHDDQVGFVFFGRCNDGV